MLIKIKEAAFWLGVSTAHVRHLIAKGRLPVVRLGKHCFRIDEEDLKVFKDRLKITLT